MILLSWLVLLPTLCAATSPSNAMDLLQLQKLADDSVPLFIAFFAPWCPSCQKMKPAWQDFANHYASNPAVVVGHVDCGTTKIACDALDVKELPTMLYFKGRGAKAVVYRDYRTKDAFTRFLDKRLEELAIEIEESIAAEHQATEPARFSLTFFKVSEQGLITANGDSFRHLLAAPDHVFVRFFTPWCAQCISAASEWRELAQTVGPEHKIYIAEVDCAESEDLCKKQGIQHHPALVLYHAGKAIATYHESQHTLAAYVAYLSAHTGLKPPPMSVPVLHPNAVLPKSPEGVPMLTDVTIRTATLLDFAFINAFAPWCGHCKRLAPTWAELVRRFKDMHNVLIAELDCGQYAAACQSNGVNGYPTLLVYKQGQKVSEYRGKREKHALVSFVKQHLGVADHSEL